MNLRALWAILILGCSSPAHTSKGNASGTGGAPGHIIDKDAGDTSTCPLWPQEKLFPLVGPFFFGPDKGPCTNTETDRSLTGPNTVFTLTYTYDDSGQPLKAATPTDLPSGVHIINYTYVDGLLQSDSDFAGGPLSNTTFYYGTGTAGYSTTNAKGVTSTYEYTLDAQDYPQTIVFSQMADGQSVDLSKSATQFVFEYADCRIQRRVAYLADGTESTASDAQFSYDEAGHLVDINYPGNELTFDYSCWAPVDASTTDGG